MIADGGKAITSDVEIAGDEISSEGFKGLREQHEWWQANKQFAEEDAGPVNDATLHGSRMAIRMTALVPVTMAVLYLILLFAFKAPKQDQTH